MDGLVTDTLYVVLLHLGISAGELLEFLVRLMWVQLGTVANVALVRQLHVLHLW